MCACAGVRVRNIYIKFEEPSRALNREEQWPGGEVAEKLGVRFTIYVHMYTYVPDKYISRARCWWWNSFNAEYYWEYWSAGSLCTVKQQMTLRKLLASYSSSSMVMSSMFVGSSSSSRASVSTSGSLSPQPSRKLTKQEFSRQEKVCISWCKLPRCLLVKTSPHFACVYICERCASTFACTWE